MERSRTTFVLSGFTHDLEFRVFAFDRVEDGRVRTQCTVRADLTLVRKYGIQVQELPLLCRRLLDQREECGPVSSLTLTEAEMSACAEKAALRSEAAKKRKPWQRPSADGDQENTRNPEEAQ